MPEILMLTSVWKTVGEKGREYISNARAVEEISALRRELGCDIKYTVDVGHLTFLEKIPPSMFGNSAEKCCIGHIHNNDGIYDSHSSTPSGLIDYEAFLTTYYRRIGSFPLLLRLSGWITSLRA